MVVLTLSLLQMRGITYYPEEISLIIEKKLEKSSIRRFFGRRCVDKDPNFPFPKNYQLDIYLAGKCVQYSSSFLGILCLCKEIMY